MELVIKNDKRVISVSEYIFGCDFNEALIHQVIVSYAAGARQGSRSQKTVAEVAGSSKKPWRQKGTGRARSGSIRSPIWRSGGVTFAAKPQDHSQKVNKKMYRGALRSILSELLRQNRLIIIEKFFITIPKTKIFIKKIKEIVSEETVLIITEKIEQNLFLSARNIYKVDIIDTNRINPIMLISFEKVIITVNAIKKIEEMLA